MFTETYEDLMTKTLGTLENNAVNLHLILLEHPKISIKTVKKDTYKLIRKLLSVPSIPEKIVYKLMKMMCYCEDSIIFSKYNTVNSDIISKLKIIKMENINSQILRDIKKYSGIKTKI